MRKFTPLLLLILFLGQLLFWSYVTFRPVWIAPPDTQYAMPRDQTIYVSFIRQAKEGSWCPSDTHTTRPAVCANIHLYFIVLGKLAALFNVNPVTMYFIGQTIGGAFLALAFYVFLVRYLPPAAVIFALLSFFLFQIGPASILPASPTYMLAPFPTAPIASSQITFLRLFGLPHHTVAEAIGLLVLLLIIDAYRQGMTIARGIGIFLGTLIAVTLLAPFVITLTISALFTLFCFALVKKSLKKLIPALVFFEIAFVTAAVYLQLRISKEAQHVFTQDEKNWWPISQSFYAYGSSLLLFLPFVILAVILLLRNRKQLSQKTIIVAVVCLGWLILPIIFMPATLLSFVPLAHFRLVDGYQYVPAAILTGLGFTVLKKPLRIAALVCVLAGSLFISKHYFSGILTEQYAPWTNVYPTNGFWDAVHFFQTTAKNSRVMTMEQSGQLLADYAPIRTFLGKTAGFPDWQERFSIGGWFYQGIREDNTAREILTTERIQYVYFGPDERKLSFTDNLYPNLLTPVFVRPGIIIYQVKNP